MPIYEFYCPDCHTVYNFLSRRIDTSTQPACPICGLPDLTRKVSLFAISKGGSSDGESEDDTMPDIDESKLEQAMAALAGEADGINEDDPRQVAGLMRKLYDATGLEVGDGMDEAIRRMEAGEDPDQIEAELGDVLENEDPFAVKAGKGLKGLRRKMLPPSVDDTLYEL